MAKMMKRVVIGAVLAMTILVAPRLEASEPMKAIVASYLEIQAQLAADKLDTVKAQAQTIGEQAAKLQQGGTAIATAAADLEKAGDIKAVRDAFGPLSAAVVAAAKADGWTDVSGLKLAYCPMVKQTWLQSGEAIQNPYFGKAMSTCGEFRKMQ
jgi:Cu(I)/Ag(I) efflux system membrane fusion protein